MSKQYFALLFFQVPVNSAPGKIPQPRFGRQPVTVSSMVLDLQHELLWRGRRGGRGATPVGADFFFSEALIAKRVVLEQTPLFLDFSLVLDL